MEQFRTNQSQEGTTGEPEITVVNIQRFEERQDKVVLPSYATNLQRVFIIDEAHRGYKPEGSFLANLFDADPNSIKIALTGTPLLKSERESWRVFGNYLHTYYYDKSVQDGYTLKIIREDIETSYKEKLEEIYHSLENLVQKKDVKKDDIIEHPNYVKELNMSVDKTALICGPPIMIKFVLQGLQELGYEKTQVYTTLELRMKCGIGKCGRCNIGDKYVCKDGPVFRCDEIDELPNEY